MQQKDSDLVQNVFIERFFKWYGEKEESVHK